MPRWLCTNVILLQFVLFRHAEACSAISDNTLKTELFLRTLLTPEFRHGKVKSGHLKN